MGSEGYPLLPVFILMEGPVAYEKTIPTEEGASKGTG